MMKKASLKKLLSTALLLILALEVNHPAVASTINMGALSTEERIFVAAQRRLNKNDTEILKIIQQRREEAQKEQMESLRNSLGNLNLGSSREDVEKISALEKEKEALGDDLRRQKEAAKALELTLSKQNEEHSAKLKEIEARHNRLLQSEKKRTDELEKEIQEAEEAKEFKGIDYMNARLKDVEDRLESLRKIADPSDLEMQSFIKQGEGNLESIKEIVDKLDSSTPLEELIGWQKKTSLFAFNFEIKALQFIAKDANKKGIQLPENFYSLPIKAQEEALKAIAASAKEEIDKRAKIEKDRVAREALLREKLKARAEEEYKDLEQEIGATPYLLSQRKKSVGTNALKDEMDKLKKYAEDDDYDKISYEDLENREKDIGYIKTFGKGDVGALVTSLRKKIDNLHKAQHPETATEAQRKFASDLYFMLPGKAKPFAVGGPPPPPLGNKSGGGAPPPPPPSGGLGGVKTIPEGEDFQALYALRLQGYSRNVPSILGLVDEPSDKVDDYKKIVLKNAKGKLEMLDGIIKNTEIENDIKAIMDGTLSEDKAYGYYLLLSTLKPATTEDISFSWQRSLPATMKAMKSLINYVKNTILPAEIEKFSKMSTGPAKVGSNSAMKVDFFTYIDEDFKSLWKIDPDLKLITSDAKKIEELEGDKAGIKNIVQLLVGFCNTVFGSSLAINKLTEKIAAIPTTEIDEPKDRIKKFKALLQEIFGAIIVDGQPLSTLKNQKPKSLEDSIEPVTLKPADFHAAIILMSHFLDEETYLKSLHNLQGQLETGVIASQEALKMALHDEIKKDMLKITGGQPVMMESYKVDETKGQIERRFDLKGNTFTPKSVDGRFNSIKKDLESFNIELAKAAKNYDEGTSIMPPTLKLLSVKEPNLRTILEKYNRTNFVIDESFIVAFMDGFNQVASKMTENKSYVATVEKVKRDYPLLVAPVTGELPEAKLEREKKLNKLVEDSFDFMQILNISKFIPIEDQAPNVPYTYVKMMLMFKAFMSSPWSNAVKTTSIKGSSVGGTGGSGLLTGVNLDKLNYDELHDLGEKIIEKGNAYGKSFDTTKGAIIANDPTYKEFIAERKKVTEKMERLISLSSFEYWEKHAPQKILTIPLIGKAGHVLRAHEEQEILEFMQEIKPDIKAKRTFDSNMKKLEKYQPEIYKKALLIK